MEVRIFKLERTEDISNVSGVGTVADGCVFPDGVAVLRWRTAGGSTAIYDSIESLEKIHGHDGKTKIVFLKANDKEWKKRIKEIIGSVAVKIGDCYGMGSWDEIKEEIKELKQKYLNEQKQRD